MAGWKNELDHAVLVCPIHQLPTRRSRIYLQAIARHVCILSYFHLAALVAWLRESAPHRAQRVSVIFQRRDDLEYAETWKGWRVGNLKEMARHCHLGTTREVVARLLRELIAAGLVETRRGLTIIKNAAGLADLVGPDLGV